MAYYILPTTHNWEKLLANVWRPGPADAALGIEDLIDETAATSPAAFRRRNAASPGLYTDMIRRSLYGNRVGHPPKETREYYQAAENFALHGKDLIDLQPNLSKCWSDLDQCNDLVKDIVAGAARLKAPPGFPQRFQNYDMKNCCPMPLYKTPTFLHSMPTADLGLRPRGFSTVTKWTIKSTCLVRPFNAQNLTESNTVFDVGAIIRELGNQASNNQSQSQPASCSSSSPNIADALPEDRASDQLTSQPDVVSHATNESTQNNLPDLTNPRPNSSLPKPNNRQPAAFAPTGSNFRPTTPNQSPRRSTAPSYARFEFYPILNNQPAANPAVLAAARYDFMLIYNDMMELLSIPNNHEQCSAALTALFEASGRQVNPQQLHYLQIHLRRLKLQQAQARMQLNPNIGEHPYWLVHNQMQQQLQQHQQPVPVRRTMRAIYGYRPNYGAPLSTQYQAPALGPNHSTNQPSRPQNQLPKQTPNKPSNSSK